jgi:general secretion pathway protein D
MKTLRPLSRKALVLGGLLLTLNPGTGNRLWAQDAPAAGYSNYQNTPVSSILDIYEQLSGENLVRDANLSTVAPISINATGLSKAEMLKLIEATLLLNGVALVPIDGHTIKVIASGANRNPRSEGVKLYANAADLPADDEVVSYYMPLNYVSATEAEGIFTKDSPPHLYGAYVVVPSSQAIILTENTSVIRQLIELRELIDVPPARVDTEFVPLYRADAEKVADLLNKLLNPPAPLVAGPNTVVGGASFVPADVGNVGPLSNEHNLISGTVQIVPDTHSNQVLVITRPVNMPFIKQLIGELDRADTSTVPQRRALKFVLAEDILPALEASIAQGKDEEDQIKNDESKTATNPTNPAAAPAPVAPAANTEANANSNLNAGNGSSGGVSSVTPPLQAPPQNNVPTVVTIGKTRILADNRSNSIIVFGSPDVVDRVFAMVDQLDRKPLQVYLATVIGELTVSEGFEFGIDILQKFQHVGSVGLASGLVTPGTTAAASSAVPSPSSLISSTGFPLPTGLTLYGAIGSTLNAYVRALETTNRFKVISRPSVYTTNNKLAVIASGSQVPVPSNTTSGFTGSDNSLTTTSSITYEDVLLKLEIIPLINANHQVTLKIRQSNNTLGTNSVISGNTIPSINTQEINTEVTVPDKSTIVIGGLISDTNSRQTSGVPYLSDIPLLGYLFKDTTKSKERDELIIMIQPTVVETDADQVAVNESEKKRTILGREAEDAAGGVPPAPATLHAEGVRADAKDMSILRTDTGSGTAPRPAEAPEDVPAASTAAPDVGRGLPKDAP